MIGARALLLSALILAAVLIPVSGLNTNASAHTPNQKPAINEPEDGDSFTIEAGQGIEAKIAIGATDPNGDFININNTPLPAGGFYEFVEQFPGLTDASITFEDGRPFVGTYSVTFTAVDQHGAASNPVTIEIVVIPPDHLDIQSAKLKANKQNVKMHVTVEGSIAPTIQRPPYGFAALTDDGNGLLAITTHAGILDSEDQSDPGDDALHTHVVDVVASGDCVNGIKVVSASFDSPGNLGVGFNKAVVKKAPSDDLGEFTGTIVSFILTIEEGNICVNPVDSIALKGT